MPAGALTINRAAATTGWSARMLRYIESIGLVVPRRSPAGYRLYGAAELQRLRTLRELLDRHGMALAELGFARRLRDDRELAEAVEAWLTATPAHPDDVPADHGLRDDQAKHARPLAASAPTT